jgi:type VII secretion protein EccE
MKAQSTFGLDLRWLRVSAVFVIVIAVLVLASHWPDESPTARYVWWSGVGVAVLVVITALTTYRRVPLAAALATRVRDRFVDPDLFLSEGRTRAVDHRRRYASELVGIREYQGRLVAMIAVGGPAAAPPGRHHRAAAPSTVVLPVNLVAAGLRQFDVLLEGIDIVSVRGPSIDSDGAGTTAGGEGTGEAVPAAEHRNTWLVLRMDPQRNVAAVATRDSVASTLAAATERLAHDLSSRRITARVVTADEFADVDATVLAGLQPAEIRPRRRRRLKQNQPDGPKSFVTSFWVSPQDITSADLAELWLAETNATAVTVRLKARRHGQPDVSVLVRYHSEAGLDKNASAGLNRLTGRQLIAVRTSLPTPMRRVLAVPARLLTDDDDLTVPLDPAPQRQVVRVGAQP